MAATTKTLMLQPVAEQTEENDFELAHIVQKASRLEQNFEDEKRQDGQIDEVKEDDLKEDIMKEDDVKEDGDKSK